MPLLRRINTYLMRWLRKKYKRLAPNKKARACWGRELRAAPAVQPTGPGSPIPGGQGDKSRMTGDCHVRICGSPGGKIPRATRPCAFGSCLERKFPLRRFSHVVAWHRLAVLRSGRPAWAGFAGFGAPAAADFGGCYETLADPAGSTAPVARSFPGTAQVVGQPAGQAQLGVAGDDQPGPPAAAGSRIFGAVRPSCCLNNRKVCSRSNRRRNARQQRFTSAGAAPVRDHHSHNGFGSGRRAGGRPAAGSGCPR